MIPIYHATFPLHQMFMYVIFLLKARERVFSCLARQEVGALLLGIVVYLYYDWFGLVPIPNCTGKTVSYYHFENVAIRVVFDVILLFCLAKCCPFQAVLCG
jgi:hypothetical protein